MSETGYLKEAERFEIQAYEKPKDLKDLKDSHVAFSGSPQRHPYDRKKVVLIADPFSTQNHYYEFNKADISYVEELPSIVNLDGETVIVAKEGAAYSDAKVNSMTIGGKFDGKLRALNELIILSTGNFSGKVVCKDLVVEAGGILNAEVSCTKFKEVNSPKETSASVK